METMHMQMLATVTEFSTLHPAWLVLGVVATTAIVAGTLASVLKCREREQTRREIAAYVAEGTIDPNTGVTMMHSSSPGKGDDQVLKNARKAAKADAKAQKSAAKAARKQSRAAAPARPAGA